MAEPNKSILEKILSGKEDPPAAGSKELDCLIYRTFDNGLDCNDGEAEEGNSLKMTRENISVQVWESKAKIRVRISPNAKSMISMERIAAIAMNAISEELKKEAR